MKLRKALKKAKEARGQEFTSPEKFTMTTAEKLPDDEWKSPQYSESVPLVLDTDEVFNNRCVCIAPDAPQLDAYKVLRTKIQQMTQDKGWNTVMITSAQPGEGKTLTTINLALTFSKAYNQTIMLVDGDLRNQNIHKILGFDSHTGLGNYLVDNMPLPELIIWPGIDKLTLISGGQAIQNSTELLGSQRMEALVQEMKDRYILFDVAPILVGADALALAPYIDCIVLVVEEGRTSMRDVHQAVEMIPQEKFLGFVMNRQKSGTAKGDRYHYNY
jgi:non-specific protein-tyrosine kinase